MNSEPRQPIPQLSPTSAMATALPLENAAPESTLRSSLNRIDRAIERGGDLLNPILVKEARQALKSRQFVITFSLLLLAAWGWTAGAILMLMPRIYFVPSGPFLLYGYYVLLAVPMLLVVPLAAHRSLAAEIDDGTLDLLSVTTLSSMQIITGKLASAGLQLMLYFVALFPCVAFSYALRGVDLMTIGGLILLTITIAILLTVVGLFLAALPATRAGQLGMLVAMLVVVVGAQILVGNLAVEIIESGFTDTSRGFAFAIIVSFLYASTLSVVLLKAAAAQLAPPSENRSTPIRFALFVHQSIMIGCLAFAHWQMGVTTNGLYVFIYYGAIFWMLVGTLLVGESPILTPRVRRNLPSSFATRALWIWMTPGPATGLIFALCNFAIVVLSVILIRQWAMGRSAILLLPHAEIMPHALVLGGYLMLFLCLTRWAMQLIRLRHHTHPAIALAVLVIVMGAFALIPYSVETYLNDYRSINWSRWQITNWTWTMEMMLSQRLDADVPYIIFGVGCTTMMITLFTLGRAVMPLRVATPQRVLEDHYAANHEIDHFPGLP